MQTAVYTFLVYSRNAQFCSVFGFASAAQRDHAAFGLMVDKGHSARICAASVACRALL
jgi:hypothetical protein